MKYIKQLSTTLNDNYKVLFNKVKRSARQEKHKWMQEQLERIQKWLHATNSKQAYKLVKILNKIKDHKKPRRHDSAIKQRYGAKGEAIMQWFVRR